MNPYCGTSAWTQALDTFERLLDEVDARLRDGDWEEAELPEGPDLPSHTPTASERDRAVALAQRYQLVAERVRQAGQLMRGDLGQLPRRREAGRAYHHVARF